MKHLRNSVLLVLIALTLLGPFQISQAASGPRPMTEKRFIKILGNFMAALAFYSVSHEEWPQSLEQLKQWELENKIEVIDWKKAEGIELAPLPGESLALYGRDKDGARTHGAVLKVNDKGELDVEVTNNMEDYFKSIGFDPEKAASSNNSYFKVLELDPAESYIEPNTSLSFPPVLGSWRRQGIASYHNEDLGIQIRYVLPGYAKADIYIYDLGQDNIPAGADSDLLREVFQMAQSDIQHMEKTGRYENVEKVLEYTPNLNGTPEFPPGLLALYRFTDPSYNPQPLASWIVLTAYKGQFVKLRCSHTAAQLEKMKEELRTLLTEFLRSNEIETKDLAPDDNTSV